MNNRIQNNPGLQYIATRSLNDKSSVNNAHASSNHSANAGNDRVSLSARADRLNQLVEVAKSAPEVNESRVDALRNAISRGEYQVNAENLAANILGIEHGLQDA